MIHVITNGDPNRKDSVRRSLKKYQLRYRFHSFERNKTNGKLGCLTSHLALYQYAKDHDMDYIWIAEDNIVARYDQPPSILSKLESFLELPEWNVLFIGGWFYPLCSYKATTFPFIFQTDSLHGTSCYVIHRRLYERLLTMASSHMHMDSDAYIQRYSSQQSYILYPILFYRDRNIVTTNHQWIPNSLITLWRSFMHHPRVLELHEWLIKNGWMTISSIVGICLCLAWIIIWIYKR